MATQGYYGIASLTGSVLYIIECSIDISKEGPIGKWKHAVMADGGMVQIRANNDNIVGLHVNGGESTDITSVLTAQNNASVTMMSDINVYISNCYAVIMVSEGSVFKVTTLADSDKPKFTGTATGRRYNVRLNGIINTIGAGEEFIIGTIDGLVSSGGQYA